MGIKAEFVILANDTDITALIRDRLLSLHIIDETGFTSDLCEIRLSDHLADKPIKLPKTGAELVVKIGYDGQIKTMGTYVVDEVSLEGPPDIVSITARAAQYAFIQTQKTRKWARGTTLGAMVKTIAKEHKLTPLISKSLSSKVLPFIEQINESDINLLTRVTRRYNAIVKPAGNTLIVANDSESKKIASGVDIPLVRLTPADVTSYRLLIKERDVIKTVIAGYRNLKRAKQILVRVGNGEPTIRLKHVFKDATSAKEAAEAEFKRRNKWANEVSVSLPGRTDLIAEGTISLTGFRDGYNGRWKLKRVEHSIDASGFRTSVEGVMFDGNS